MVTEEQTGDGRVAQLNEFIDRVMNEMSLKDERIKGLEDALSKANRRFDEWLNGPMKATERNY